MRFKKISVMVLGCVGVAVAAQASEVRLFSNQPVTVVFRVAHQAAYGAPMFGGAQSLRVSGAVTVPVALAAGDRLAGLVIVSVNGHVLPTIANQFNQPKQCAMTTDNTHPIGQLTFTLTDHVLTCRSTGGVF